MEFLESQNWEIRRSTAMRFFGSLLFGIHIILFFSWFTGDHSLATRFEQGAGVCWSFFPNCAGLTGVFQWTGLFIPYVVAATLGLLCYLLNRGLGLAWVLLLFCFGVFSFSYTVDFGLATNLFAILIPIHVAFLFLPSKPQVLRILIFSYYIASGLLKMNPDWLSGYWVSANLALPDKGYEWIAAFSVMIEMVMPFFIYSRIGSRMAWGATILVIYHVFEWIFIESYLTPAVSIGFVLFYVAYFFEIDQRHRESLYQSFSRPEPTKAWVPIMLVFFWSFQLIPQMSFAHGFDTPLTFRGQSIPPECQQYGFAYFEKRTQEISPDRFNSQIERLQCESSFHWQRAKSLCDKYQAEEKDFETLASFFLLREYSAKDFRRIFELSDLCKEETGP